MKCTWWEPKSYRHDKRRYKKEKNSISAIVDKFSRSNSVSDGYFFPSNIVILSKNLELSDFSLKSIHMRSSECAVATKRSRNHYLFHWMLLSKQSKLNISSNYLCRGDSGNSSTRIIFAKTFSCTRHPKNSTKMYPTCIHVVFHKILSLSNCQAYTFSWNTFSRICFTNFYQMCLPCIPRNYTIFFAGHELYNSDISSKSLISHDLWYKICYHVEKMETRSFMFQSYFKFG